MIRNKILPVLLALLIFLTIGASAAASVNTTQIGQSAETVKSYVEANNKLPTEVTVGDQEVTPSQFLYLLTTGVQNVNSKNKTAITVKTVAAPPSPTESVKTGTIAKSEYLSLAKSVKTFVDKNGRLPNYVTTSLGKMRYESMVYMYSKIMNYYNTNKALPNSVSVKAWGTITPTPTPTPGNNTNYTTTMLGQNSYGFVQKLGPFGTGANKVAVIIGVHPQEGQAHLAVLNAIKALASTLDNIQIWVYQVRVYNATDYTTSRTQGQNLASKYVVPNIDTSFKLALDVHSNRGFYYNGGELQDDFVFAPSNGAQSKSYANKLIANTDFLKYYQVADGTSPNYVTIPIAKKGIPAVIYEVYQNVDNYQEVLYNYALQVVKALNASFN